MTMAPPVPVDCDLAGFDFMPLEVRRLTGSDLARNESPEACWTAELLWAAFARRGFSVETLPFLPPHRLPANGAVN